MTTHDDTEELGAADTDRTGGTGARGIATDRGRYHRVRPEKWRTVNVHGHKACPQCGAIVANWRGKAAHEQFHEDADEQLQTTWAAIYELREMFGMIGIRGFNK